MKVLVCVLLLTAATFAAPSHDSFRIVGGEDAKFGQYPYQASLRVCIFGLLCSHTCGATILNEKWLLTAAHCITTSTVYSYEVQVGIYKLSEETAEKQTISVSRSIVHPGWNDNGEVGPNDVAVLELSESIKLSTNVRAATLPAAGVIVSGNAEISGWGTMSSNTDSLPDTLQRAIMPIITIPECIQYMQALLPPGIDIPLDQDANICTGSLTSGVTVCSGDSGGPLAQNGEIFGIVSWGINPCGTVGAPSVFTKVSNYVQWIEQSINTKKSYRIGYY